MHPSPPSARTVPRHALDSGPTRDEPAVRPELRSAHGTRRPAYGSNPVLGPHGNRAREEILDAAWTLFGERGYHGTTVEAIGTATGRSGASFYQYFANKNELFLVFVYDLGADLLRHASRLGALDPGPRGFNELRSWLDATAAILQRHATTFRLWASVEQAEHTLVDPARTFLDAFSARLAPRFAAGDLAGADPYPLTLAILRMTERAYFLADMWAPDLPTSDLTDGLARLIHLTLFPSAGALFEAEPLTAPRRTMATAAGVADVRTATATTGPTQRRTPGPRSRATIDRLLAAAGKVIGDRGFQGASVPDIVAAAGVGHGTFYSYWSDLAGVFAALSTAAATEIECFLNGLQDGPPQDQPDQLLRWLQHAIDEWLTLLERHRGVLRTWSQEPLPPRAAEEERAAVIAAAWSALSALLGRQNRAETLPPRESGFLLAGLLLNFPQGAPLLAAPHDQIGATLVYIIGRSVFGIDLMAATEASAPPAAI
jgi:AcrR family transcriptional regulator